MNLSDFLRRTVLYTLVIITPVIIMVLPVKKKIRRLEKNEKELTREISVLKKDIVNLEREKKVLEEGDPYYYERLIRSDLNME